MNLTKIGVAKFVVAGVVGIGTEKIVSRILKSNVKAETLLDKVSIAAAGWVIAGIATGRTKEYTSQMIDDIVKNAGKLAQQFKLRQKIERINRKESTFEEEGLNQEDYRQNKDGRWELIKDDEDEEETVSAS